MTSYRLTEEDEDRVLNRIREHCWRIADGDGTTSRPTASSVMRPEVVDALVRTGAHSVGCSIADLRDGEIETIRSTALVVVGEVAGHLRRVGRR